MEVRNLERKVEELGDKLHELEVNESNLNEEMRQTRVVNSKSNNNSFSKRNPRTNSAIELPSHSVPVETAIPNLYEAEAQTRQSYSRLRTRQISQYIHPGQKLHSVDSDYSMPYINKGAKSKHQSMISSKTKFDRLLNVKNIILKNDQPLVVKFEKFGKIFD
mmetsp:Transcript_4262/g.7217  ORF Transcript_4262/g.7217 Transcript_4262/m.7217 type:complete len:162 (-) Transcript_4262:14-499(-)